MLFYKKETASLNTLIETNQQGCNELDLRGGGSPPPETFCKSWKLEENFGENWKLEGIFEQKLEVRRQFWKKLEVGRYFKSWKLEGKFGRQTPLP